MPALRGAFGAPASGPFPTETYSSTSERALSDRGHTGTCIPESPDWLLAPTGPPRAFSPGCRRPVRPFGISSPNPLRLRSLVDALLLRSPDVPLTSGPDQESHAATEPELHRHPHPGDAPVRATRRRAKTDRRRDSGAPHDQCKPHRPTPGADQ